MQAPLVSVIMPVYNGERFISEAIDSVCSQTLQEWELIIVNDGSTDQTQAIVRGYSDERIILVYQENAGEANARNKALSLARGKYIAFLDADDLFQPNALSQLADYLSTTPEYGAVYSDGVISNNEGLVAGKLSDLRADNYQGNLIEHLVIYSLMTVPCCVMVRVDVIREFQISFDEQLVIGPDWDFYIQLARKTLIGYLPIITCTYRIHVVNISKTSGIERRKNDLIKIRRKVLSQDWFYELSEEARRRFFLDLLANLLHGSFTEQKEVISSRQFMSISRRKRSVILYRLGITSLLDRNTHQCKWYLRESLSLEINIKSWLVLVLVNLIGSKITRIIISRYQKYAKNRRNNPITVDVAALYGINQNQG